MATTTTNYGWTIPQSSDLVRNGATAIATLGQNIDDYIAGSSASGKLFYIAGTDSTTATQTTTSATFVQKTDCQVTFTTGKSGVFVVILWANIETSANTARAIISYDVSGGATVAASDSRAVLSANTDRISGTVVYVHDGTPSTSTTVTLDMRTTTATTTTATCYEAVLQVVCLG